MKRGWLGGMLLVTLFLSLVSLGLGRYQVSPPQVVEALFRPDGGLAATLIWQVRLPRVLLALMVGAGLGVAGAAFQGVFRNPLVAPDILGVAAGGGFGAALALLLGLSQALVQLSAFGFGLLAVSLTFLIARLDDRLSTFSLVLAGVIVGSFFAALISLLKYVADSYAKLPAIVFWLMGSLAGVRPAELGMSAPLILGGIVLLILLRWRFNLLSLGSETAQSLGLNTRRLYTVIVVCATLITAAIVAIAGVIGWVGLVVPHLCRLLLGADHRRLLPASALMGASFMLLVDDAARCLSSQEIPLGIVTALIGAPFFVYLLKRRGGEFD
ncbi:MAG: putative ABC transporter permease protein [Deltaproteobacteria bacterium ADurb.Bin510]|nr:MAG: putative ABC transporter permease protein [Deltaproteobacteria bacterium ADurb.Bin510]